MAVPTMDFDWLLDHASAIAFDPSRPSIYVFGLDMTPEELQEQVLSPMAQHDLFAVAQHASLCFSIKLQTRWHLTGFG